MVVWDTVPGKYNVGPDPKDVARKLREEKGYQIFAIGVEEKRADVSLMILMRTSLNLPT